MVNGAALDATPHRLRGFPDRRAIIAFPYDEGCIEMFGGRHGLGAQGRQPVGLGQLGHPKPEDPDRHDRHGLWKRQQGSAKGLSTLCWPGTREPSTAGRYHALAQSHVVQVGRGGSCAASTAAELRLCRPTERRVRGGRRGPPRSRRGQIWIVGEGLDEGRVIVAAENITKQAPTVPSWHGQHPEPEIDDIDRTALIKLPSVTRRGGEGNLPGG